MSVHFVSITGDETGRFCSEVPEDLMSLAATGKTPQDVLDQMQAIFAKGVTAGDFPSDAVLTVRDPDGRDVQIGLSTGPARP